MSDHLPMSDELHPSRVRVSAALLLILVLGLLCAVSAVARPLRPAFEQTSPQGEQESQLNAAVDPRC
jgi:hypothetical protein